MDFHNSNVGGNSNMGSNLGPKWEGETGRGQRTEIRGRINVIFVAAGEITNACQRASEGCHILL